jgi:hypothetical protein
MAIDVRIHFLGQCLWVSHNQQLTVLMPTSSAAHAHDPHVTRAHFGAPMTGPISRWKALSDVSQGDFEFRGQPSTLALPGDVPDLGRLTSSTAPVKVKGQYLNAPWPVAGLSCRVTLKGGHVTGAVSHDYTVDGKPTKIASHVTWDGKAVLGSTADLPKTAAAGSITELPEYQPDASGVVEFTIMHIPLSHVATPSSIPHAAPPVRTRVPHCEALYDLFARGSVPVPQVWFEGPLGKANPFSVDPFLCVGGGGGE